MPAQHLKTLLGAQYELVRCEGGDASSAAAKMAAPKEAITKKRKAPSKSKAAAADEDEEDDDKPAPKAKRGKKAVTTKAKGKEKEQEEEEDEEAEEEEGGEKPEFGNVMLAQTWKIDGNKKPDGLWMSEKLDGVR